MDDVDEAFPYVRLNVRTSTSTRKSISPNAFRLKSVGFVNVQCFVPEGIGTKSLNELADRVAYVFNNWRSSEASLRFKTADYSSPQSTEDGFYQLNVIVEFHSHRTVTRIA